MCIMRQNRRLSVIHVIATSFICPFIVFFFFSPRNRGALNFLHNDGARMSFTNRSRSRDLDFQLFFSIFIVRRKKCTLLNMACFILFVFQCEYNV